MAVKAKEQVTVSWIIDIASTTKYYLLQSSTATPPSKPTANPPGGNWKTAEPAYTSGSTNTLYTIEQTLWTNGKVTYSAVCKSSSYEAAKEAWNKAQNAQNTANSAHNKIDGLQIGGRNLARGASSEWGPWFIPRADADNRNDRVLSIYPGDMKLNDVFTVSFDIDVKKFTAGTGGNFKIFLQGSVDNAWIIANPFVSYNFSEKSLAGDFTEHVSYTCKITHSNQVSASKFDFGFRCNYSDGTGKIRFKNIKVEKGNIATDWTPAPEDTDIKIESYVESEIKKEEDSIKLWAGQTYTAKTEFNTLAGRTSVLETWKNEASQKITQDGIIATVGSYYVKDSDFQGEVARVTNAESKISQLSDSINLRVEKSGIISAINQTAEKVTISASKVNLSGYVSILNLKTAGKTVIDGSNITTGTVSADRIDAKSLFAKQLDATNLHVTGKSRIDGGLVTSGINAGNITVGTLSADRIDVTSLFSKKIEATDLHVTGKSTFDGVLNGATGTFTGELSGATGTFSGTLNVTRSFSVGNASVIIGDDSAKAIILKPAGLTDEYGITYDGNAVFDTVTANYFNGNASQALTLRNNGDPKAAAMTFHWSGQTDQPTWLWGGKDITDMYVYSPSNLSVKSAGVTTHMAMPRVATDVNANGRPALNRAFWREYNPACDYLPDANWYHIFTGQGADDAFTTQLALGMTTTKVAYRCRNAGTWGDWREIPLLSKIGDLTIPAGLYPTTGIYDKHGYANTTTNLNYACYVSRNYRIARYASSSKRYKHDIAEIFDTTCRPEALYDLPVVTYRYNDGYCADEPHGEKLHIGFIAEDVAKLYPVGCGYVNGVPENWNVMEMVPGMLRLIQDQHKDIIKQSTRQDAVESRMNSLQYQLAQAFDRIAALEKENKSLRQALS